MNQELLSETEIQELMRQLLHKEGTWVDWGKTCQQLQKAGVSQQTIFEGTGFQASHQTLIIVASQVYDSLLKEGASEELLSYARGPRSDILYELRVLNQQQRAILAQLAFEKKVELDEARELAKAYQEFSRLAQLPNGFSSHPGDAMAYRYWRLAKQKKELAERARLIAKGLKFAHSQEARTQIEQLLSDFTVVSSQNAPLVPVYRLEKEEDLGRIVPIIGTFPLTRQALESVPNLIPEEPFRNVKVNGQANLVMLPGWQVILKAQQPVAIFAQSDELPKITGQSEQVLVIVDLAIKNWNEKSYFLIEDEDKLAIRWFEKEPICQIFGQLLLVLRPKKILDENNLLEPWQMDD
jgi:Rubisco Assembly chaperone C-terminal domain/Rubisco accumulation factor 1 alpha helical domain/Rubisco accumulation factor 1 helix turn helix domain